VFDSLRFHAHAYDGCACKRRIAERIALTIGLVMATLVRSVMSRMWCTTRAPILFRLFLEDGCVDVDSNLVENAISSLAINRRTALFASQDEGSEQGPLRQSDRSLQDNLAQLEYISQR